MTRDREIGMQWVQGRAFLRVFLVLTKEFLYLKKKWVKLQTACSQVSTLGMDSGEGPHKIRYTNWPVSNLEVETAFY